MHPRSSAAVCLFAVLALFAGAWRAAALSIKGAVLDRGAIATNTPEALPSKTRAGCGAAQAGPAPGACF